MAESLTSISGISSGIDFKSLVEQIVTLERRPAAQLEAKIAANTKRRAALNDVQTALAALQTAAEALKGGSALDTFSTVVTGTDASGKALAVATAGTAAAPGSYDLVVERLATAQKTVGSVGVSAADPLGVAGTFAVKGQHVDVAATDTLAQVRDKVNALAGQTGVRATIVTGGANDARLVLTGNSTGAANAFAVTDVSGTVASAALGLNGAPTAAAQDSRATIDGIAVERPTNVITDALAGVTLTLNAADANKTVTLAVERYKNSTGDAVKGFVDAYNKARGLIKQQTATGGALAGDGVLRSVSGALSTQVLTADSALPVDMTSLAAAGISVQKDGTLTVDSARLDAAYGSRLEDMRAMLASRMGAVGDYLTNLTAPLTGLLDQRESGIDTQSARMQARVTDIDARLDKKRTSLLAQYAKFEATLGRLKAVGDSITAQISGLNASNDD